MSPRDVIADYSVAASHQMCFNGNLIGISVLSIKEFVLRKINFSLSIFEVRS